MNPHSYRLKGRDFVHQGKIEIDVNERAVFIRTQGCFFVYTNSDCFLNRLSIKLFDFQEKAVIKLIDLTSKKDNKQTIIMKAPTGSGKTIILIDYVDTYLTNVSANTAFIWLCPGKGNLEEQSRKKMMKFAPGRTTQNLFDALLNGFAPAAQHSSTGSL